MSKVYAMVQERIIKELEKCLVTGEKLPWEKPWTSRNTPKNFMSKKKYRGVNLLLLPQGGYYVTFNQFKELKQKYDFLELRKGTKAHMVVFWQFKQRTSSDAELSEEEKALLGSGTKSRRMTPIFRYYNVFHESQIEGFGKIIPEEELPNYKHESLPELAETFTNLYSAKVCPIKEKDIDLAAYSVNKDYIVVPPKENFKNLGEYYSTKFHEMGHSTGHISRLQRFDSADTFGDEKYSKEELIAEICSSMLMSEFGIESPKTIKNSNAYILGWLSKIRNDAQLITFAAQQAQKACDFMFEKTEIYTNEDYINSFNNNVVIDRDELINQLLEQIIA